MEKEKLEINDACKYKKDSTIIILCLTDNLSNLSYQQTAHD